MIVRGLRAVADFEYEYQMVGMNRALDDTVETVFLMAEARHQAIASRLVKELRGLGATPRSSCPRPCRRAGAAPCPETTRAAPKGRPCGNPDSRRLSRTRPPREPLGVAR
jgi:hypothetical protein